MSGHFFGVWQHKPYAGLNSRQHSAPKTGDRWGSRPKCWSSGDDGPLLTGPLRACTCSFVCVMMAPNFLADFCRSISLSVLFLCCIWTNGDPLSTRVVISAIRYHRGTRRHTMRGETECTWRVALIDPPTSILSSIPSFLTWCQVSWYLLPCPVTYVTQDSAVAGFRAKGFKMQYGTTFHHVRAI